MYKVKQHVGLLFMVLSLTIFSVQANAECPLWLQYKANALRSSETIDFCERYQNKLILAVNTASQCGFTPQFKELEILNQRYQEQGLVILGFPSNDFRQEFSESTKTANVCYVNYGVTFQMFETSSVKGSKANGFFRTLAAETKAPQWNFNKYLIDTRGNAVRHYPSHVKPIESELEEQIKKLLSQY